MYNSYKHFVYYPLIYIFLQNIKTTRMKKQSLLLITGGLLALASCNTDTAGNNEEMQAKVDSMVNERVEEIRMELQMKNDSLINELAMYRADSIMAAMKGTTVTRPKPKKKASLMDQVDPNSATSGGTEQKSNPKDERFGGKGDNTDKKAGRFDENAAEKEKQSSKDKKADRFK